MLQAEDQVPEDINFSTQVQDDEAKALRPLPKNVYWWVKSINVVATTFSTFGLGLLAGLLTHRNMTQRDSNVVAVILLDAIAFSTAIIGKTSIMLFFNQALVLEGARNLYVNQTLDFFNFAKRSFFENIKWTIGCVFSLNISIFWTMVVFISFNESGKLLKEANYDSLGDVLEGSALPSIFAACSFFTNFCAWPGVHSHAWHQKADFIQWLSFGSQKKEQIKKSNTYAAVASRRVMLEIKNSIDHPTDHATPFIDSVLKILLRMLSGLTVVNSEDHIDERNISDASLSVKIQALIQAPPALLKTAYLEAEVEERTLTSVAKHKHLIALGIAAVCIWGYENILTLSNDVWGYFNLEIVSQYGASYLALYSMAEVAFIAVYPMICNLVEVYDRGMTPPVFSSARHAYIISMVFFVGGFGGLANAEQSQLAGEPAVNNVVALIASFLLDAVAIYTILRLSAEDTINRAELNSDEARLKQLFLGLQERHEKVASMIDKPRDIQPDSEFEEAPSGNAMRV